MKNIIFSEDVTIQLSSGYNIKKKNYKRIYIDLSVTKEGILVFNQFYSKFCEYLSMRKKKSIKY